MIKPYSIRQDPDNENPPIEDDEHNYETEEETGTDG